ncbi:hypothetical protein LX15_004050 [Streptoalloteichus tenebrarius]|uniref:Lipoprotein n=1 Tax=Streptoalloteichus tenebrarius (strain ATCC 17920 / DSM 40477 / JCM 4838 / CBS 697.72 / NBRC 16177 / NCIMB 11028 / NRRL B-12390 / A12253. 1 / ISP 5477) TaxID=1933 RepID=A0ABT1HXS8_STRSD|nr:hypothetical protein [Streptoalloteichus tenebrarius]MCP2260337.1 hypothetical protein [Streptoalloteichus tenebrarius]BFF03089.1 hypothetical protein GCM10020241_47640 [Streptoalloteichus tenebrarius]
MTSRTRTTRAVTAAKAVVTAVTSAVLCAALTACGWSEPERADRDRTIRAAVEQHVPGVTVTATEPGTGPWRNLTDRHSPYAVGVTVRSTPASLDEAERTTRAVLRALWDHGPDEMARLTVTHEFALPAGVPCPEQRKPDPCGLDGQSVSAGYARRLWGEPANRHSVRNADDEQTFPPLETTRFLLAVGGGTEISSPLLDPRVPHYVQLRLPAGTPEQKAREALVGAARASWLTDIGPLRPLLVRAAVPAKDKGGPCAFETTHVVVENGQAATVTKSPSVTPQPCAVIEETYSPERMRQEFGARPEGLPQ